MNKPFVVGGITINNITLKALVGEVNDRITTGQRGYILTPNVAHIILAQDDTAFKAAYDNASWRVLDSMPLKWVSRLLGTCIVERITGTDIVYALTQLASEKKYRIYLLGGEESIVCKVKTTLEQKFPNVDICGYNNGYFGDQNAVIDKVNNAEADIIIVALGFGKQEKWLHSVWGSLNTSCAVCVGGVFDVIAGKTKRAPVWIQNIGLEWFWRVMQEPGRLWKRYLVSNTRFLALLCRELMQYRLKSKV